jgi:hypothetical protein
MKSSLCLIHRKRTASFRIVGLMLAITSLGVMLALANRSAQAQASADVSSAATSVAPSPVDWSQFHREACETSNQRSSFAQKRNCRCCLQRIRERMRRRCSEPDSLNADRIAVFRPNAGDLRYLNGRF